MCQDSKSILKLVSRVIPQGGILDELPEPDNPPVPKGPAHAGPTYAHTDFTEDDTTKNGSIDQGKVCRSQRFIERNSLNGLEWHQQMKKQNITNC